MYYVWNCYFLLMGCSIHEKKKKKKKKKKRKKKEKKEKKEDKS